MPQHGLSGDVDSNEGRRNFDGSYFNNNDFIAGTYEDKDLVHTIAQLPPYNPTSRGNIVTNNQGGAYNSSGLMDPKMANNPTLNQLNSGASADPVLEILEQPKARGLRFRYKCEGRSAGAILGDNSTQDSRTYPTIQIKNFNGLSAIIVVSCVSKDDPPRPHPHSLVGKDCKEGVCTVKLKGSKTLQFPNLGIQCSTKKEIMESLKNREKIRVDPFGVGYFTNTGSLDLNVLRLAFQCFLPDKHGKYTRIVPPVVSQCIYDKKAVNDLVICRLSCHTGKAKGGDEVFMLTEKVNKDDIQVKFFEFDHSGVVSWSQFADFGQQDVHRQFAIVFRTPAYKDPNITEPHQVFLQLTRPSDGESSDPKPFQYTPDDPDPDGIERKRKRKLLNYGGLMADLSPQTAAAYPPSHLPTTIDQSGEDGDDKSTVKQRLKLRAQRNMTRNAEASNNYQAAAPAQKSDNGNNGAASSTAMSMFEKMSKGPPAPSSTATSMFQRMTAGAGNTEGATAGAGGHGVDLGQFTPFLTDQMSLSQLGNLPSLPSFSVSMQQLQQGGGGEGAEGGDGLLEHTVAAEEEVVMEEEAQGQGLMADTLVDTISINTQNKIYEAIDKLS